MDLSFLKSARFWQLFLAVVAQFLASQNIITSDLANAISALFGGSVVIRTIDKNIAGV